MPGYQLKLDVLAVVQAGKETPVASTVLLGLLHHTWRHRLHGKKSCLITFVPELSHRWNVHYLYTCTRLVWQ